MADGADCFRLLPGPRGSAAGITCPRHGIIRRCVSRCTASQAVLTSDEKTLITELSPTGELRTLVLSAL
ncbi:hypothetical protein, partial [Pseudomonas viridiflava]|uniref:hypothetical protein n=1 Tax=Pseudomonas viridiflava TaxID=33069 RepID=UPI001980AA49